jgi:hypothetical protein
MAGATAVGTAVASPFDHGPPADPELYYKVDNGSGYPVLIMLVKGGSGLLIHF